MHLLMHTLANRKETVSGTISATSVLSIAAPGTPHVRRAGGWRAAIDSSASRTASPAFTFSSVLQPFWTLKKSRKNSMQPYKSKPVSEARCVWKRNCSCDREGVYLLAFSALFFFIYLLKSTGLGGRFVWVKLLRTYSINGIFFSFPSCVTGPHETAADCELWTPIWGLWAPEVDFTTSIRGKIMWIGGRSKLYGE